MTQPVGRVEVLVDIFLDEHAAVDVLRSWFVGAADCLLPEGTAQGVLDGSREMLREVLLVHSRVSVPAGHAWSVRGKDRINRFIKAIADREHDGSIFLDLVPAGAEPAWPGPGPMPDPIDIRLFRGRQCHDWGQLSLVLAASHVASESVRRRLLQFLKGFVGSADANFGQVGPLIGGSTALEVLLPRPWPEHSRDVARSVLRGYSWFTIGSPEVAARLGGADAVRRSGAFAEVEQLANGGLSMLATDKYDHYDLSVAERIFPVLAPALPAGLPKRTPHAQLIAAHKDPAQHQQNALPDD